MKLNVTKTSSGIFYHNRMPVKNPENIRVNIDAGKVVSMLFDRRIDTPTKLCRFAHITWRVADNLMCARLGEKVSATIMTARRIAFALDVDVWEIAEGKDV